MVQSKKQGISAIDNRSTLLKKNSNLHLFFLIRLAVGCGAYGIHFSAKFIHWDIFSVTAMKEAAIITITILIVPIFKMVSKCIVIQCQHVSPLQFCIEFCRYMHVRNMCFAGKEGAFCAVNLHSQRQLRNSTLHHSVRPGDPSSGGICVVPRIHGSRVLHGRNIHTRCVFHRYKKLNIQFFGLFQ